MSTYNIPMSAQALILPINKCIFSAGYKNEVYRRQQGYNHYGVDLFSTTNQKVYACGDGEVVAAGLDGKNGEYSGCGNVVVIIYRNVYVHGYEKVMDLTCRMFHFQKVFVKAGDKVNKDTVIGLYGNTGGATVNGKKMGYHLHIEFDTDTKYPLAAVGISGTYSQILTRGTVDSTVNPSDIWFIKKSSPDNQTIQGKYPGWYIDNDIQLPSFDEINWYDSDKKPETPNQKTFYGIDVSYVQGAGIDWNKVAKTNDFVMCRIGWCDSEGVLKVDDTFHANAHNAFAAGLKVGGYVYSYARSKNAAKLAAQAAIKECKKQTMEYPIAFDVEDPYISDLSVQEQTEIAKAFCEEVERLGYYSMVYANKSWLTSKLDMNKLQAHDVWLAEWSSQPTYKGSFGIWQFAGSEGRVDGVKGACDRDIAYQDYAAIIKRAGLNNFGKPVTPTPPPTNPDNNTEERIKILEQQIAEKDRQLSQLYDMLEARNSTIQKLSTAVEQVSTIVNNI